MRTGVVDPDAWFLECPTVDGVTWIVEKHKLLPVSSDATWDYTVFNSCQEGESCG